MKRSKCPKCGAAIGTILLGASWDAYCSSCGVKISTKCEKCDNRITINERYCSHCGAKNPISIEKE
jgi:DNA-directed RNA polymerase subunit RPC12/RpoP